MAEISYLVQVILRRGNRIKEYKNYISLGYNFYTAFDLRELGLRDTGI